MGNPRPAGGGGIGWDASGGLLFAFSHGYGTTTNNKAELRALHDAMKISICRGYNRIFLEFDSKCMVNAFIGKSSPTWKWRYWWTRIRALRIGGTFLIFRVPREVNGPADELAKAATTSQLNFMYLSPSKLPIRVKGLYRLDQLGFGSVRET
ncbi:uncharacterized protein LOC131234552 [Magnolia sinica]|uniref:uncharacterized protein LOC131234552 n=1 Tax=Magnolia sinica TaxID=86752 RepID=UPI002659BE0B|nr:uncharacterized protein LOC131234552 [Magnolia sinica]